MNVLDVLEKLDTLEILYEPIYSADEHVLVGYEVIGFILEGNLYKAKDLIYDDTIPAELRIELQHYIVEESIKASKEQLKDLSLYLPCNPNLLMSDFGEAYFNLLKKNIEVSLLPQIYLVIPEHKVKGDFEQLLHPIRYIKTYGVKVALDNIGSKSNLDKILMLEPTVLKINVNQLNYNKWGAQNHVFTTIQSLALKIGATLMFDNIQTDYQLHHAWKNGARYFKGENLQKPVTEFISRFTLKEKFRSECQHFISTEKKLLESKYVEIKNLQKTISTIVEEVKPSSKNVESLLQLSKRLEAYAFRFYICNEEGFQTSPNIFFKDGAWNVQNNAIGKNWSWRPYFLFNIIKMRNDEKGQFSSVYSDIETGELTRTYSMPVNNKEFVFIDIMYDYLFEHNIVN
ncbi:EAL domain-containing protein [Ureibacillus manganicus]|uniref:Diguanylate phosphodiesterase n=1 Tax=Ureibacillus manganicus DSM 26584 TaxID=1384049 RepID=A0A0A3HWR5_9BACL|nr:EAL-associated domain-containing protein [Ureibacillus manganicus]KGR76864.1 diguanylate phosphodiesterase [Ureibacillus manganicus DSM 26584]